MNILFYVNSVKENKGGVERVTSILGRILSDYGYRCYVACFDTEKEIKNNSTCTGTLYLSSLNKKDRIEKLLEFISNNNIDIIVNQKVLDWDDRKMWRRLKKERKVKIISCLHTCPDFPEKVKYHRRLFFLPFWLNKAIYHIYKVYPRWKIKNMVRVVYKSSDRFVLLANQFVPVFITYYRIKKTDKVRVIYNPLAYDLCLEEKELEEKEKVVLLISRIDVSKRVDLALKIWYELEQVIPNDWRFEIVGDGPDLGYCRELAEKLCLKHVTFYGYSPHPEKYYRKASIFLMTSAYEGWGMVITEALQMGLVPVVFDTFLSLSEVIEDGVNGYRVPEGDISLFVQRVKTMIEQKGFRQRIALNALYGIRRFDRLEVCRKWDQICNDVLAE